MAVTINADTSNGLVMTPDTSGEIKLQSAGADIATVTANGIDVTGDFAVDTNTLYVDSANNNVGINTSTLQHYGTGITNFTVAGSAIPIIHLNSTGGASNAKLWRWIARNDSTMQFQTLEDNYGGERNIWNVVRSGADISYQAWHTGASIERMRIDSSGNVLVGTTSGSAKINTFVNSSQVGYYQNKPSTGDADHQQFYTDGTLFAKMTNRGSWYNFDNVYGSLSDATLKENISDATSKLDDLMQVQVRNFNFISDENKTKQIGVIAQELESIFPSMVDTNEDGIKSVKYSVFVPMLIKAIQEQQDIIKALETRIQALENA